MADPFLSANPQPEPVKFNQPAASFDDASSTGAERMRSFEDRHFGADAVRIDGQIERGHGSRFNDLDPTHRREHAAIERLIEAEKTLANAEGALSTAQSDHDAAKLAVERASEVAKVRPVAALASPDGKWEGPTIQEYVASGYSARNYPPQGYASRSTPEEVAAAVAEEKKAEDKRDEEIKAADKKAAEKAEAEKTKKAEKAEKVEA